MECKNCSSTLREEDEFCSYCGSRIIGERISVKFIFKEVLDKVLSVDNKLLKTFWHLFSKPEVVISGYIDGVRKRYFNPFSYLLISITLAGIATLITRDVAMEAITAANSVTSNNEVGIKATEQIMNLVFDYQSFMTIISIPLYAFVSWLVFFNKKKFNYLEHNIIYIYTSAQLSVINFLIVGSLYVIQVDLFLLASIIISFIFIVYNCYTLIRLFKLTFLQFIIKTLYFLAIGLILYIIVSILVGLGLYLYFGPEYLKEQFNPKIEKDSIQNLQHFDSIIKINKNDSIVLDKKSIAFYEASSKLNCLS